MNKVLPIALTCAISLAIGFGIGRWSGEKTNVAALPLESATPKTTSMAPSLPQKEEDTLTNLPEAEGWPENQVPGSIFDRAQRALSLTQPYDRARAFDDILRKMTTADGPELVAIIQDADKRGVGNGSEWAALWNQWGKIDGAGAFEHLLSADTADWHPKARSGASFRAIRGWAESDPHAAVAFFQNPRSEGLDSNMELGLLEGWSWHDPDGASNYVLDLEDKNRQSSYFRLLTEAYARKGGLENVDRWFRSLRTPDEMKRASQQVSSRMFSNGLTHGLSWIEENISESWMGESVILNAAKASQKKEGVEYSLNWISNLEENESSSASLQSLVSNFSQNHAEKVGAWLSANTTSPHYDALSFTYVSRILNRDAPNAAVFAQTIKDPNLREKALNLIVEKMQ